MRIKGLEPPRLSASDPKSDVATNYTISAGFERKGSAFLLIDKFFITFVCNKVFRTTKIAVMKLKFVVLTLFAVLFVGVDSASAQVRKWELELGAGLVAPNKMENSSTKVGWGAMVELRKNLNTLPFDFGFRVDGNFFDRKIESISDLTQFKSYNALLLADLNILRQKKVQIFLGCGVGYGWLASSINGIADSEDIFDTLGNVKDAWQSRSALMAMPRVGVELWHHLRATVYYKAPADKTLFKEQGHFGVSVGVVIGGGLKNKEKAVKEDK